MTPTIRGALRRVLSLLVLAAAPAALAQTTDQLRREVAAVGVVERLGAEVPRQAAFTDSEGRALSLAQLGPRPLLLSFNYTGCPRLCGLQLHGLARALKEAGWRGEDFSVVTVSIDPAEKREQLARYKQGLVREVGDAPEVEQGWRFVTGSRADVAALAEAVGFKYRYDPATGEFAHQATLVVLTGDGRVSGYLHGITYAAGALRTVTARAAGGAVATLEEQRSLGGYLLSCMGFDPADPAPLALKIMRAGGVGAVALVVALLGLHLARDARRRRAEARTP